MKKLILMAGVLAMVVPAALLADTITIGPSAQDVTITATGSASLRVTFGASGGSCPAGLDCLTNAGGPTPYKLSILLGEYLFVPGALGIWTPFLLNEATGNATVGPDSGSMTYLSLTDGSPTPRLSGTWSPFGTPLSFDFNLNDINYVPNPAEAAVCNLAGLPTDSLDCFALTGGVSSVSATISSGGFTVPATVPESSSLILFGTGLLGFGFLLARRQPVSRQS